MDELLHLDVVPGQEYPPQLSLLNDALQALEPVPDDRQDHLAQNDQGVLPYHVGHLQNVALALAVEPGEVLLGDREGR